jgi:N-acetylneuraminate synthase
MAKDAGCDYVKLQKREVEWCYSPEQLNKQCDSPWGSTVFEKVRGRELDWRQIEIFDAFCESIGIQWISSCFDLKSLNHLHELYPDRPLNKIPSAMALRDEFVLQVAKQGIRTLISTGLLPDDKVIAIADVFDGQRCEYVLNHVVSVYPCPDNRLNLLAIPVLAEVFHHREFCVGIGYSGHETGILPSVIAAQLGAVYIERHITTNRAGYGADQSASLEGAGLNRLVRDIHNLPVILGTGKRELRGDEKNPVTFWKREP